MEIFLEIFCTILFKLPIILDAASNMGFGALLFSSFLPIQYIGGLMVFAMVSTSLGTLTVLSALAELLKKKLVEK